MLNFPLPLWMVLEAHARISGVIGSGHKRRSLRKNEAAAEAFMRGVPSAVVMWECLDAQFCDGGEFGFGGEIGISTGRLHARGPVGVAQLTTYRYEVRGDGQTRP